MEVLEVSLERPLEYGKSNRLYPFANSEIVESKVVRITKLTDGEDVKDVYDICLDITDTDYDYQPGDTIGILPHNDYEEVNKILEILNIEDIADNKCCFYVDNEKKRKDYAHMPATSTLRRIFLENVDIRSPAKKSFLKILSKYCKDEADAKFLIDLCLPNKSGDYVKFISNDGRTLLGLLRRIPMMNNTAIILENLPPLQPRPYSIASSPLLRNELHIAFSVVNVTENLRGVCSSYLEKAGYNSEVIKFYFRKPSFRISGTSSPVIMVGPGTGVAPFIGFLQHLSMQKRQSDTWLFYGCRYKDRDFLYQSDIKKYLDEGCLGTLSLAFSREQADKIYVTHLMRKVSSLLYEKIVHEDATFYVCGDGRNMIKDVRDAVIKCLEENGMTSNEAEGYIQSRIKDNKYVEDKWV